MKILESLANILNEDFKTQAKKFIEQGNDSEVVNRYINDFKIIRDNKYKELFSPNVSINVPVERRNDIDAYKQFNDLEVIVDYVKGQRQVKTKNETQEIEVSGKPVFEDDNFVIYYADTPRACIQYKGGVNYGWCVSQESGNMYYAYRLKEHEPAFYFVKDKKEFELEFSDNTPKTKFKYPYHFFVIQVLRSVNLSDSNYTYYVITSANNDGDKNATWNDILAIKPSLAKYKGIFKAKSLSPEEREKVEKYQKGLSDMEFENLPYEEKKFYLDVYPSIDKLITTNQFISLPDDLKKYYIGFGLGLNEEQFENIKDNSGLVKRYIQILKRRLNKFLSSNYKERDYLKLSYRDIILLDDYDRERYISSLYWDDKDRETDIPVIFKEAQKDYNSNSFLRYINKDQTVINFLNAYLKGKKDFSGIDLSKAILAYGTFAGINLSGANLESAKVNNCDFTGVDFTEANLEAATFEDSKLLNAKLVSTNCSECNFIRANLINSDCRFSNFAWTFLTNSNLNKAIFEGTDLTSAYIDAVSAEYADFRNSILKDTSLVLSKFLGANFSGADVRSSDMRQSNLTKADFTKANLGDADLYGAITEGTIFTDANLVGVKGI